MLNLIFSASLLQSSVSHDPSEIILMLIYIQCFIFAAEYFLGPEMKRFI